MWNEMAGVELMVTCHLESITILWPATIPFTSSRPLHYPDHHITQTITSPWPLHHPDHHITLTFTSPRPSHHPDHYINRPLHYLDHHITWPLHHPDYYTTLTITSPRPSHHPDHSSPRPLHHLDQCFSTFSLKRNLLQEFWLLTEPSAMSRVSVLLHKAKWARRFQMQFKFFTGQQRSGGPPEPLAATGGTPRFRGTLVEKH